ncbi:MAG: PriCT-2 domain-containing protein [Saprospiraceae bacterium]|nr:PriCT-2 domain-containing protein [Saprospiraceae bacterium]
MQVTLFKNLFDTKAGTDVNIETLLDDIRLGKYEIDCGRIRQTKDKAVRDELKKKVPNFTACGTFKTRKNSDLVKASGLIAIDFDNIPQDEIDDFKNELCQDSYTFAVFISISGTGICCLVKIDPAKFAEAFTGLQTYYYNKYERVIDPACKDLSRARLISHDPTLFHNPGSLKFKEYPPKEKKVLDTKMRGYLHVHDKFEKILYSVNSDICGNYLDWFRVGMSLANHYGDKGLEYFRHISQFRQSSKKDFDKLVYKQFEYCLNNKDKSIDIGTLYFYIKQAGYTIKDETTELIANYVYHHKKAKLSQEASVQNIIKHVSPTSKIEDVENIVKTVYEDNSFNPLLASKEDDESIFDDIIIWLKASYDLKKNEITKAIDNAGKEMEEEDLNTIYIEAKKLFPKLTFENLFRIINSTHTPKYNPVKEYIESIQYDGGSHIKNLVKTINSDTGTIDWRYRMFKRWLVGMIESIYGGQSVLMLVLTGPQKTGKTQLFLRLFPEPLKKYFGSSQLDHGKDSELLMTQKLVIFDDEFGGKSKQDSKRMKMLLSADSFSLRAPYGKKNMEFKRLAILCGTSNDEEILNDPTGNRRIVIMNLLGKGDYEAFNKIDKEQLIAEALYEFNTGATSNISDEDQDMMNKATFDKHYQSTQEAEMIMKFFLPSTKSDNGTFMMATEIKDHIEKNSKQMLWIGKLSGELKKLGFKRTFSNKHKRMGYWIQQVSQDATSDFTGYPDGKSAAAGEDVKLPEGW